MRSFGFLFILMLFMSCQDIETNERPKDLIPPNKMVEVLTDLSLLNSAKNINKRMMEEKGFKPDEFLLTKYNIDSVQLVESTRYYARNYAQFEGMYEKVQRNLEAIKSKLEIQRLREERERDSIMEVLGKGDSIILDSTNLPILSRDSLLVKPIPIREREEQL